MRVTKKLLKQKVYNLNSMMGEKTEAYSKTDDGRFRANPGTYVLDMAYGGYRLGRICNEGGGESNVLYAGYMKAGECAILIDAYVAGLRDGGAI